MKKFLSYGLVLLLTVLSVEPGMVHAHEQTGTDVAQETVQETAKESMSEAEGSIQLKIVNPLYADVISEDDLLTHDDLLHKKQTAEEAAEEERSVEESAEESNLYTFSAQGYFLNSTIFTNVDDAAAYMRSQLVGRQTEFTVTITDQGMDLSNLIDSIKDRAMEHTGNAKEGDSLKYQWAGMQITVRTNYSGGVATYSLTFVFTYYTTAEQEQELDAKRQEALASLNLDGKNQYERLCAIYDYIAENVTYDFSSSDNGDSGLKYSAYAAMVNHTSVCQGYSVLLYQMLLDLGIDCRVIDGTGAGGNHAWNIVCMNGKYYNADVTWDSCYLPSGHYHYWFMNSENNFENHIRSEEFLTEEFNAAYPMGETNYEYNQDELIIRIIQMYGVVKPEAGAIQSTDGVTVSTRGVYASDIHWETSEGRVLSPGERFVAGNTYRLCTSLELKTDYTLADEVEVMLNVQPDEGGILEGSSIRLVFGLDSDTKNVSFYNTVEDDQPLVVKTVEKGSMLTSVPEPFRDGYTWAGWFLDKELTQPYTYASHVVMSDMSVYGAWTQIPLAGTVSVTGKTVYGETLTAKVESSNVASFQYQWKRGTSVISGAVASAYTLGKEDIGQMISCEVSSDQAFGSITGTADDVVDKADGPAAPTGLEGKSESAYGASDGEITGVTVAMEYATKADFSDKAACTGSVINGLTAGTYYVRVAETGTTKAGAAEEVVVVCAFILGDINGDNTVDAKDRMYLARALAGWDGYAVPGVDLADFNGDGEVNAKDRMYLARKLAGWEGYE